MHIQTNENLVSPDFFRRLAAVAAREALPRFRLPGAVVNKAAGGFDPVTEADRETERAIRDLVRAEYPGHGILGEEFGNEGADAGYVWVIDPIDGTRSFISGIPLWGTLVGLTENGQAVAGMMAQPFIGELFYAAGNGAFYEGPRAEAGVRLSTTSTQNLADATLFTTTPAIFEPDRRASYDRLEKQVRLARYGTDCYAYCMLAAGQIDCVVEAGLYPYDIVALIPIIEQAGGVVTDWDGRPAEQGGGIVAAANAALHTQIMGVLHGE
ncbi:MULTISPECIES: histidinol-phosphatase [Rhizobium]|uniref:Histidinol-phosphatase n=1 Tax=Rhizobium rhizogenes NBRC 13257 TaxID=1220581 RepID=A0AA87Q7C7_RHIRH|nr:MULTISPECIES: histidinol-phosphatase [Rhizobium]MBO9126553.1 histidinol-phosphatase [Rhizobium sp. 16-488-2b]MBO9178488.1 histidinol-phosphatase [Rhizobium sp. 16-488-2a]MBO9195033.1 histidinol-phosphatase [Rhizobium sp. 16-449-1b]NTG71435.1 histidinol-phosphatase [Rhizobium rhizogenes]NTI72300.1 histidinol-phosphatase [Rhizobium rhizogenes]